VGCRRFEAAPTTIPTVSPTPRSTPLPALPTSAPLGSEANPLQMVVVSSDATMLDEPVAALETALTDATGISVRVIVVATPALALQSLCDSPEGAVSAAWLEGLSALAAQAQGCGDFSLAIARTIDERTTTTASIQMIAARSAPSISALADRRFCRVSLTDLETWLYPSILLESTGFDIARSIPRIDNYATALEVAETVARGTTCQAAGVSSATLAALDEDVRERLTLVQPTLSVPYGLLTYPEQVSLHVRTLLDNALLGLSADDEQGALITTVLGADALRPFSNADLESLRSALTTAGLDPGQIGR
jgi:ABC-type phosphate/phosphonate transport system substrate-binding protein